MKRNLWVNYMEDYMQTLQQRHKWKRESHIGKDGKVRAADLKKQDGSITRSITKNCPL